VRRFFTASAATAFAAASALGILLWSAPHAGIAAPHDCINPAGHVRGWCRHNQYLGSQYVTGRAISIAGVLVQFARSNGRLLTLDQQPLLARGIQLVPGRAYTLAGYTSGRMFYATAITWWGY